MQFYVLRNIHMTSTFLSDQDLFPSATSPIAGINLSHERLWDKGVHWAKNIIWKAHLKLRFQTLD